jgi:mannose-6-phosphate isomerase-like protein (cupin superfamily)
VEERELVVRPQEVAPFAAPGEEGSYESRCLISPESVGSTDLEISHFTLKAGVGGGEFDIHPGRDECYYILRGKAKVTLGGEVEDGGKEYEIGPDTAVFIPGGTLHRLDNRDSSEDLVLIAMWPKEPGPGVNYIYDARKRLWGTTFRKVSG